MAGTYHFTFYARRSIDWKMTWLRDREPVPMGAGWTARMQCRDRAGSSRLMTEFSTADGSIVLGATDGTIQLVKGAADTLWEGWRHGVYDLVLTEPDGDLIPLLVGTFDVVEAVTV